MKPDHIPLVWDNGRIGSVAPDANGILRLRHAIDDEMERDLLHGKDAATPAMAPPYHRSPEISAADVTALIAEIAWPRK